MLFIVAWAILQSCRFAPSIAKPTGTPEPSVSRLRLTFFLALSVGLGPVFSPAEGGLGHGAIHGLPRPIDPFQLIIIFQSHFPQLAEHTGSGPFLKPRVSGTTGTNTRFV